MKKILLILAVSTAILFGGCAPKKNKHVVVHNYKVQEKNDNDVLVDVLYYVINNSNGCYYTSSPTPITNFSSVSWTSSKTIQAQLEEENAQELGEQEIETEQLSQEIQTEVEQNAESFEDSQADAESAESDSNSDSGSDSGSDGGGDSGGGDGGGGDGGGGGE